jgi:hypothetical protein
VRAAAFKLEAGKIEFSAFPVGELAELKKQWAALLADPIDALVIDDGQPFLLREDSFAA